MEADWAAEIGPRLDRIDVDWPGFIDLRRNPGAVDSISETAGAPEVRAALALLNAPDSPVFTCKCDCWSLPSDDLDPREYDYPPEATFVGVAAYVDVVARDPEVFVSFDRHERWARSAALRLRQEEMANGRADLVIRPALDGEAAGFGLTLYAAGCGLDASAAEAARDRILRAAIAATMMEAHSARGE